MDRKSSFKLNGLISKLTKAANKSVSKKKKEPKFPERHVSNKFRAQVNLTQLSQNLRVS